jgi:hypothetical protein
MRKCQACRHERHDGRAAVTGDLALAAGKSLAEELRFA